jgi:hypothetical protein
VIRWRTGTVTKIVDRWPGVTEVAVDTGDQSSGAGGADGVIAALAYVALVGVPQLGDRVLVNTTALAMGLGTGGHALVVAIPDRLPADPVGPGHMVKARYTPGSMSRPRLTTR